MERPQTPQESLPSFWRIFRHFWPYIRKHRVLIAGSSFALVSQVGLRLLEPWPLKFVFDHIILTTRTDGVSPVVDGLDPAPLLILAALGVVAIAGVRALVAYWNTVGFALVGNRVLAEVRNELYHHLQRLPLSFHTKAKGGDLTTRVVSDVNLLRDGIITAILPLLGSILILLGMLGVMLWLNWHLTLLALAPAPLFWISATRLSRRIQEVALQQRQRQGALAATAAESMGAIKVVQALSLEGMFSQAFVSRSQKDQHEDVQGSRLGARLGRTVDVLIAISTALVLWYGAQLVLRRALTPGELLVFLSYLRSAFRPVRDFAKYTKRLAKASAAGKRVLDILERTPEVRDLPGAVQAPNFRGAVRFEAVRFAYEPGHPVLEQIEFDIQPGQRAVLVGPSGIGKSTLVSLILRLYDPVEGRVIIDGHDIRTYTLESLRSQISMVLQDTVLFAVSVRDNIACAAPTSTPDEIEAAARLANAHEFILALPQGYDTVLGERGVTLSTGQRQRIAIARAAIRRAPILILDEPTTGLDEENRRAVIQALDRLARNCTTFLITHDLHLNTQADLILYLEGGQVPERGTHADLMHTNGRYATLYRLQTTSQNSALQEEQAYALTE